MGKEQFRNLRGGLWYWYRTASAIGFHVFICFALSDDGFLPLFAAATAGILWVALGMVFIYGVYWKFMEAQRPKEIQVNTKPNQQIEEKTSSIGIQMTTGNTIVLQRISPEDDLERVKWIKEEYPGQPLRVWEDIRDAYNSKLYRKPENNFSSVRLYAMGEINKINAEKAKKEAVQPKKGETYHF